ncbi:hypothetical protein FC758_12410 [Clostridium botulinum]|nr:hypothetical protein [Clostridium botulinum]NFL58337.1 hypothetical protein [Clostridium botulinum]NFL62573.1 hypothetical protein [Clostridium botulinum]
MDTKNEIIINGYKEVLNMKQIDIARTKEGVKLWDKYSKSYNLLMEAAEEIGLDYKLILNTINSLREFDEYNNSIKEMLIRNDVI